MLAEYCSALATSWISNNDRISQKVICLWMLMAICRGQGGIGNRAHEVLVPHDERREQKRRLT